MVPTFVIGLREGLEAALIVGIIAAFLRKQGRRDLLRWVFVGVGVAVALCLAAGIALDVVSRDLPQRQQEGLETVIGALAVAMVTYMVVWMKRHSRNLKGQLEGMAADAMSGSSAGGRAMIAMAFLAVLREGIETVVFLVAVFNQSTSGASAPAGAALGIAVAVLLGYGIYRGGVRINLSKFFRATGLVLVLVAAGLVVNALRSAHEAGWLDVGQRTTVDLSWLVSPGSVQSSLLTGMLGLQARPVVVEVLGWLLYLIPVGVYVAWPPGRSIVRRTVSRALLGTGAVLGVATVALAVAAPSAPAAVTGPASATVSGEHAAVTDAGKTYELVHSGSGTYHGVVAEHYSARGAGQRAAALPATLSWDQVAARNGGNLPIGLVATPGTQAHVAYRDRHSASAWIDPRTGRLLALTVHEVVTASVRSNRGIFALARPVETSTSGTSHARTDAAVAAARADSDTASRHAMYTGLAWTAGVLALVLVLAGAALSVSPRGRRRTAEDPARKAALVNS